MTPPFRTGLAVLALLAPALAAAENGSNLFTRRLANGIEVLVFPDPVVPLVTAELVIRNGASYETPATSGLAHLYEHVFWPDLRSLPAGSPQLKDRGISFNASTRDESTNFYMVSLREDLRDTLAYLHNAVTRPDFAGRVPRQSEIVLEEIRRADANPYTRMKRRGKELLFPRNRTFKNSLGTEGVVGGATARKLQAMAARFVIPSNIALVVTGDCDPEAVFRLCADLFGSWTAPGDPPAQSDPGEPPARSAAEVITSAQVQDTVVNFAWRGPGVETDREATLAADVLSEILRQPDSRFQRTLVDSGLTVGVDIVYETQLRMGVTTLLFKASPDKARDALRAAKRELAALAEPGYFTDQELENARTAVIANELKNQEDLAVYAHSISYWWASAGTPYLVERFDATRRIGREAVLRFVKQYLHTGVHSVVAVVPEGKRAGITTAELLSP